MHFLKMNKKIAQTKADKAAGKFLYKPIYKNIKWLCENNIVNCVIKEMIDNFYIRNMEEIYQRQENKLRRKPRLVKGCNKRK